MKNAGINNARGMELLRHIREGAEAQAHAAMTEIYHEYDRFIIFLVHKMIIANEHDKQDYFQKVRFELYNYLREYSGSFAEEAGFHNLIVGQIAFRVRRHRRDRIAEKERQKDEHGEYVLSLDYAYKSGRSGMGEETNIGEYTPDPNAHVHTAAERRMRDEKLRKVIGTLPDDWQRIINAHYFLGISDEKIGEEFGVTRMAINDKRRRALARIRKALRSSGLYDLFGEEL
jgi:RNA polymerase sigma factor (sigma-70 family)